MNRTLVNCYRPVVEFKFLASNSVVMAGNIIANMLIILILIKTKQWPITLVNLFFWAKCIGFTLSIMFDRKDCRRPRR